MRHHRIPPNAHPAPKRGSSQQSLRNRIAARILLAALVPAAVVYGLRFIWNDVLGMPQEHISYQVMVASLVLILSACLASLFSGWMVRLLRGKVSEEVLLEETPRTEGRAPAGSGSGGTERGLAFGCLLEAGSDAVIVIDHGRGEVRGTSRRFREIFGLEDDGRGGLAYSEVKTRVAACLSEPDRFAETWSRMATSGASIGGEQWRTAGPEGRELRLFSEPLATGNDGGEDESPRVWIFVDITAEVALRAALCRARRLESVGTLVGGLAHDFNNMLTGVMGNLALAEIAVDGGKAGETGRMHLERARFAGMRAAELARHLVGYTCVSGGGRRRIDVAGVLREVERLVRPGLEPRITFRVDAEERLGAIVGDAGEIELVLVSLCVDAREALRGRDDGEITLIARSAGETDNGVELLVTDNRPGGAAVFPAALEEIVERQRGRFSRDEGGGGETVFKLLFPRLGERESGDVEREEAGRGWAFARDGRGRETVLIVDDEEVVRAVGEKMLVHRGYTVRVAASGQEALDRYDAAPFEVDAVLLDATMPGLSGAATFRMLKERDAALPVIVCSGYEVDAETFEAENGWCPDGILRKPFDIDGLAREVRRVLDAHVGVVLEAEV